MANKFGQIVNTASSGGLTVMQFWVRILEFNEASWNESPDSVLTDEEIQRLVFQAFPLRTWSKGLGSAMRYRASYNRGSLTRGTPPRSLSYRYTREAGRIVRWEAGKRRSQWDSKPCNSLTSSVQVPDIIAGRVLRPTQ